ncbi:MAG: hypothetical protein F4157_07560, partial [Synechococcus sp. SB0675_bin_6]|nr:hypothetical protein [Synechococcus sp. SB0675_bin_6]
MSLPKEKGSFWRAKAFSWDDGRGMPRPGDVFGSVKLSGTELPQPDKPSAIIGSDRIGSDRIGSVAMRSPSSPRRRYLPLLYLPLLLTCWAFQAKAQSHTFTYTPTEIYEGETLTFVLTTDADSLGYTTYDVTFRSTSATHDTDFSVTSVGSDSSAGRRDSGDLVYASPLNGPDCTASYPCYDYYPTVEADDTYDIEITATTDSTSENDETITIYWMDDNLKLIGTITITIKDGQRPVPFARTREAVSARGARKRPEYAKRARGYKEENGAVVCHHGEGRADLWFEILLSQAVQSREKILSVGYKVEMQDPSDTKLVNGKLTNKDSTKYIPVTGGAYQFNVGGREGDIRYSSENDVHEADGVHTYRFTVLRLAPELRGEDPIRKMGLDPGGSGFGKYTVAYPYTSEVKVCDNDPAPGTMVFSPGSVSVPEGDSSEYKVKLSSQPSGPVTVTVGGTSGTDVTVDTDPNLAGNQNTLTFMQSDWKAEKTVRVT